MTYKFIIFALIDLSVEPVIVNSSCSHSQGFDGQFVTAFEEELDGQGSVVYSGTISGE